MGAGRRARPRRGPSTGSAMAQVLAGAWRRSSPPAPAAEILAAAAPLLLKGASAALAWWRLRNAPLARTRPARELRAAYRLHALQAADHERHLRDVLRRLRAAGVEPVLVKGWAAARLYPEIGLRPYSDIDLCIHPEKLPAAMRVLTEAAGACGPVELHEGVPDLPDRPWEELFGRSWLVRLGETDVRLLGPEDHLRLLCLHLWRHLGSRPLWLCDIAAALESLPADFDWEYCLRGRRDQTSQAMAVMALAGRLLGARLPEAVAGRAALPRWLAPAVLWRWGAGEVLPPQRDYVRRPSEVPGALLYRWLNPMRAAWRLRLGAGHALPVLHLLSLLLKPVQAAVRLGRRLAERLRPAPARPFDLHRERVF